MVGPDPNPSPRVQGAPPETVLVVDDSDDNRRLVCRILAKSGYNTVEAQDGEQALLRVQERRPDLILLDVVMPKMDGFAVCDAIQRQEATADIPVIFLSAQDDVKDKIRGLELGGSDYITKPFDKGEVLARVRSQLKIRRLTREIREANRVLRERQERLDEDLRAAGAIQRSLLPAALPDVPGLEMAWQFLPSQAVGGDIFNVFRLDEWHLGVYMLDVSGHGVPAAMITVSVSQTLQPRDDGLLLPKTDAPPYRRIASPREVLARLDAAYPFERFDKYFTIVYLVFHLDSGAVAYSSAGHPPAVLLHPDGEPELLDAGGSIIGLGGTVPFDEARKRLEPGDRLILYTDGIVEYERAEGDFFGMERFLDVLREHRRLPIGAILGNVVDALAAYGAAVPLRDDATLLGFTVRGRP